jgi:pyruvate dehydrogenase E2 component (dihydrolipoamide acetyltransferase)
MATPIVVPHLGESVEAAVLVQWHKAVGDAVKRGDEIADVETDKAVMPLEAPQNGVLIAQLVTPGTEVRIGQLIAMIGREGETYTPPTEAVPVLTSAPVTTAMMPAAAQPDVPSRRKVSPLARRMAREHGIDLNSVPVSSSDKISSREIERVLAQRTTQPQPVSLPVPADALPFHRVALSPVRRVTGRRMLESVQTIPQFAVSASVDATELLAFRAELGEVGNSVTVTTLLLALTAAALSEHPHVNACYDEDALLVYETVNIGVAVASDDGLRVLVLRHVETLTLREIQTQLSLLADKARAGRLAPADIEHGTFSISNLGMYGTSAVTPLVNPPQAAILGVGAAQPVFVPDANGQPRLIQQMMLTLSADHRVIDGVAAAAFLATLKARIEGARWYFLSRL